MKECKGCVYNDGSEQLACCYCQNGSNYEINLYTTPLEVILATIIIFTIISMYFYAIFLK